MIGNVNAGAPTRQEEGSATSAPAPVPAPRSSPLIVGERDHVVIDLNRDAFERLSCVRRLEIVPGAAHVFEEPGTLEEVTRLARAWFEHYLMKPAAYADAHM